MTYRATNDQTYDRQATFATSRKPTLICDAISGVPCQKLGKPICHLLQIIVGREVAKHTPINSYLIFACLQFHPLGRS